MVLAAQASALPEASPLPPIYTSAAVLDIPELVFLSSSHPLLFHPFRFGRWWEEPEGDGMETWRKGKPGRGAGLSWETVGEEG